MKFSTVISTMAVVAIPAVSAAPVASQLLTVTGMGAQVDSAAANLAKGAQGAMPSKHDRRQTGPDDFANQIKNLAGEPGQDEEILKRQEDPSDALKTLTEEVEARIMELEAQMSGAAGKNGKLGIKRTDHEDHEEGDETDELEDIVDELFVSLDGEDEEDAQHKKPMDHTKPVEQKWPTQTKRAENMAAAAAEDSEAADELFGDLGDATKDPSEKIGDLAASSPDSALGDAIEELGEAIEDLGGELSETTADERRDIPIVGDALGGSGGLGGLGGLAQLLGSTRD